MVAPARQWFGVYMGRVLRTRTTDNWVILQVPQILGTAETNWAAPVGYMPTSGPNVGDLAQVQFIGGDINHPVYHLYAQANDLVPTALQTQIDTNSTTDTTTAAGLQNQITIAQGDITTAQGDINALISGTWVPVGLVTGWSARSGYPPFRVMKSGGLVMVQGTITNSGSIANGATIASFGSGYYNTTYIQSVLTSQYQGTAVCTANELHIEIGTTGSVLLYGISSAGSIGISFNGYIYTG